MDLKRFFLDAEEIPLKDHHDALAAHRAHYVATLLLILEHGVEPSPGVRARVLAAAWARRDHELAESLLARPLWNLPCVVKALQLLDAGRQSRALRRRIERHENDGRTRPARLALLRTRLHDLEREGHIGSVSGALARHVRRWMQTIAERDLTSVALSMPREPWRQLADLVHPNPASLKAPWFLPVVFGGAPPADSALAVCPAATDAQMPEVASSWELPYVYLRTRVKSPSDALRGAVARYETLDTLLWYYEELRCAAVDQAIARRLDAGEASRLGCGKLMERVMVFRDKKAPFWEKLLPLVDRQLARMKLPLDPPVVVLGDASSSMTVAIRVATIIGSVLTVVTRADLRFFNQSLLRPAIVPRTTRDVLGVTDHTPATGMTAPAAALWPSLEKRELVRSFLVVTDEEENTPCQQMLFDAMLAKYRAECFPARVTFVSFIGQMAVGQMAAALKLKEIPYRQVRLDRERPDLTRLDTILGELAVEGELFNERVGALAAFLATPGARIEETAAPIRAILG